ncbi:hypothetical protein ES288_D12G140900v1, partial [Gossypium darwinii]
KNKITLDPLVPNQTVLQCRHHHRFRHSINPTPSNLSSPAFQHNKVRHLIKKHTQSINMMCNRSEHRFIFLLLLNIFYNCQRIAFHNQSLKAQHTRED